MLLSRVKSCTDVGYDSQFHKKGVVKQAGKGQEAPTLPYFLLIPALLNARLCLALS